MTDMAGRPKNLTQLKRYLAPGMTLVRSHSKFRAEPHDVSIVHVQGTSFACMIDGSKSWHRYLPSGFYSFDDAGFTIDMSKALGEPAFARYAYASATLPQSSADSQAYIDGEG